MPVEKVEGWDAPEEPAAVVAEEADRASGDDAEGTGAEAAEVDMAGDKGTSHLAALHSRTFSPSQLDHSTSRTTGDEKEGPAPAKRKRGVGADGPEADAGPADAPEPPAGKRPRTKKPAKQIPEEPEEEIDYGEGGGEDGRPGEGEGEDAPPAEPEVESSEEDEPGETKFGS